MTPYVKALDGARPVCFLTRIDQAPPDCEGADADIYEYVPVCPECSRVFESLDRDKFCRNCGTKLYWDVMHPKFIVNDNNIFT